MICLDTNAVIAAINRRPPRVRPRLERALAASTDLAVSAVTLYELWYGIRKSMRPQQDAAALATFLSLGVAVWPFDADDAADAGDIRASLERKGTPIGPYDLLIAAQARRRGAILVTTNAREFARVPRLKMEDWAAA
jgi:tRNA(fMet)-specific endonuclease VapC